MAGRRGASVKEALNLRIARSLAVMLIASGAYAAESGRPSGAVVLEAASPPQVVFNWQTDRCEDTSIPDSPARAYRRSDGRLIVVAAHYQNQVFEGSSFDDLRMNCTVRSLGRDAAAPEAFDTRYWLQGLLPLEGGRVFGLVSHEYMGRRFGRCDPGARREQGCWYSAILATVANESSLHFQLPNGRGRFVAAPPLQFDPARPARTGFIATSNIVTDGEFAYALIWREFGRSSGTCLFRAPVRDPLGHWVALRDGTFQQAFSNPYASDNSGANCDVVAPTMLRSVIRLPRHNLWVGVYMRGPAGGAEPGVYYTTSSDLRTWSEGQLLYRATPWWAGNGCGTFHEYPSLIDHSSRSRIFDDGDSDIHLYLTEARWPDCRGGLDRNLVRLRVQARAR